MTSSASDLRDLALRLGLAGHPGFATAIRERLILEVMTDVPTAHMTLGDVADGIQSKFGGVRLTVPDMSEALDGLRRRGWLDRESPERTGDYRYFLTLEGQEHCNKAHREGRELERSVRDRFFSENPGAQEEEPDGRWAHLIAALNALFEREAVRVAEALLGDGPTTSIPSPSDLPEDDPATRADLRAFLESPDAERAIYLRRMLHGAFAIHLFRSRADADAQVIRHLQGRTFLLDTTVVYALASEEGELSGLGEDLLRLARALECRLEVTAETMTEFQESVAHYKRQLLNRGITDAGIARALIRHRITDLDDFRGGFYRALIREPGTDVEAYALRFETIEERFPEWGIPRPQPLPASGMKGPDGRDVGPEGVADLKTALAEYLERHPRRVLPKDPRVRDALIHHDALHLAWIAKLRQNRGSVAVPTRPSQVHHWFLTRDRTLTEWDRAWVREHGPGRIGRCLGMEEWVQAVAVCLPELQDRSGINAVALRLVALHAPAIPTASDVNIEDLQRIGRVAQTFELTPEEAGRLVADQAVHDRLGKASTTEARIGAVQDGVIRIRDEQVTSLESQLELFRKEARVVPALRSDLKVASEARDKAIAKAAESGPDAAWARQLRRRFPWAMGSALVALMLVVAGVTAFPTVWGQAGLLRRLLLTVVGFTAVILPAVWILGFQRRVRVTLTALVFVLGGVSAAWDLWERGAVAPLPSESTEQLEEPDSDA